MEITFESVSKQYKRKYALKNFTAILREGVYGQDVRTLGKAFLSQIGYMPQYPVFYRNFTVKDFLLYMCALKDIPTHEAQDQVSGPDFPVRPEQYNPANTNAGHPHQRKYRFRRTIYFINENSLLTAYDTRTHKARPFRNVVAYGFCLTDQGLYFINRMDSDCVYLCGRDDSHSLKISNAPALSVDYDGGKVTMILKSDGKEVIFEP